MREQYLHVYLRYLLLHLCDVFKTRHVILINDMKQSASAQRVVVYGGGYIGTLLSEELKAPLITRRITSIDDILGSDETVPDVIINAIGKTGVPNVDWCEDHKAESYFANVHVPYLMAEFAKSNGIKLVHLSSGCVFEGDNAGQGFGEDDAPNFQGSYYSHTKVVAERLLSEYSNILTLRIRMPISAIPTRRNLISKLLSYERIIDVPNSVTVIEDFLPIVRKLLTRDATGIVHCVNPGAISHREILTAYEAASGAPLHKIFIDPRELDVQAPRSNTILRTDRLDREGLAPMDIRERIPDLVARFVQNQSPTQ